MNRTINDVVVLEEEEYLDRLDHIIERDFFPKLNAIRRDDHRDGLQGTNDETLGVDAFLATHTSEDNDAFRRLQEKHVKEHRRKYWWAYNDITTETNKPLRMLDKKKMGGNRLTDSSEASDSKETTAKMRRNIANGKKLNRKKAKEIQHRNTNFSNTYNRDCEMEIGTRKSKRKRNVPGTDGYAYLRTPLFDPDSNQVSPLVTWGHVESTPQRIESVDVDGNEDIVSLSRQRRGFAIPRQPARENTHHELERQRRASSLRTSSTIMRDSGRRLGTKDDQQTCRGRERRRRRLLSPAGRILAKRLAEQARPSRSGEVKSLGSALRASYKRNQRRR